MNEMKEMKEIACATPPSTRDNAAPTPFLHSYILISFIPFISFISFIPKA